MNRANENQNPLALALQMWRERESKFPGWHALGVSGDGESQKVTFYIEPGADIGPLQTSVAEKFEPTAVEIMPIPRFRALRPAMAPGGSAGPPADAISTVGSPNGVPAAQTILQNAGPPFTLPGAVPATTLATPANILTVLEPGQGVTARNNRCSETTGTIGTFLKFVDQRPGDPILVLSACHVLARSQECNAGVEISADNQKIISGVVIPVEINRNGGNLVDAAVASLVVDNGIPPSGSVRVLNTYPLDFGMTSTKPIRPDAQARVDKIGHLGKTQGTVVGFCPRIDVDPDPAHVGRIEMVDQMLIESSSDHPFLGPTDSGALVVSGGRPAGLLVAIALNGNSSRSPLGVASPFEAVLAEVSRVLSRPVEMMPLGASTRVLAKSDTLQTAATLAAAAMP
ncbi:MAG TPA: hypothetical protein VNV88_05825 [Candidatus Solibacter sp.]|jgi:hypothetical protein|nr:hypothetical protein [Candidatus Solibacter sp.]